MNSVVSSMTLEQWSEAYVKIRAECVRCCATLDFERLKVVKSYLDALPSFHYEHKVVDKTGKTG